MNLNDAALAHAQWELQLRHQVSGAGKETFTAEQAKNDAHCDLGRWIHGEGARLYAGHPEYERLKQAHVLLHECAGRAVALAAAGKRAAAECLLLADSEFTRLSMNMVAAIDACKKIESAEPDYSL